MLNRVKFAALLTALLCFDLFNLTSLSAYHVDTPSAARLDGTRGGACQDCKHHIGACVYNLCQSLGNGTWRQITGTLITPADCFDVASQQGGAQCKESAMQDCVFDKVCLREGCAACGEPRVIDQQPTVCTVYGEYCTGQ
jgi:hypothetical protein